MILALVWTTGCDREKAEADSPESSGSRVNAVQAEEEKAPPPKAFCDKYYPTSEADTFEFAKLEGQPPAPADGWRWVNIWATWCKPCIEEMPRLIDWRDKLADKGLTDLVLVSVDESRKVVDEFRNQHPETPESLLITKPEKVKPWVDSLGLHPEAPLPVHV
ncbi:MAG: TlpA family protein disulfide reductase, partial [Bradymonadaceae bacterium]